MHKIYKIEGNQTNQVLKVRKLFPFQINGGTIIYESKNLKDLYTMMIEEESQSQKKMIDKLHVYFRIFYDIVELSIKIYQIINLSKLNQNTILIDFTNDDYPKVYFSNLHERNNLVSYDENFQEIKFMCFQAFKSFLQKQRKVLDDKSSLEEKQQTTKEIHEVITLQNEFLSQLETSLHFKNLQKFLNDNYITLQPNQQPVLQKKQSLNNNYNNNFEQSIKFDSQIIQGENENQEMFQY